VLALGAVSSRRLRRAREAAITARLPIEVSRLRLGLREALRDVHASRERLVEAGARERRRLERDLHDGAQQQIVAVGMRLRRLQSRFAGHAPEYAELDDAVASLEETIGELRRLANGVRPSRLDEGLPTALRALVTGSPVPVQLRASEVDADDTVRSTVYFVVAEAYANTLKHANAHCVSITLTQEDGVIRVVVRDDGVGGARTPLTAVDDRVASIGGRLVVQSPPGEVTTVTVEIPNAHRRRG
jgi:signal transduction histidine kinase